MGANMMPMVKNKGRTVLGVRIGLLLSAPGSRNGNDLDILPSFQPLLSESRIYRETISMLYLPMAHHFRSIQTTHSQVGGSSSCPGSSGSHRGNQSSRCGPCHAVSRPFLKRGNSEVSATMSLISTMLQEERCDLVFKGSWVRVWKSRMWLVRALRVGCHVSEWLCRHETLTAALF